MSGTFDFIRAKYPEIAQDGEKAESYLFSDDNACMFYISRVFDNVLKAACGAKNITLKEENGQERKLIDLIDELAEKKLADKKTLRILHNMRKFRNKNAHNEAVSFNDNLNLFKQAELLCRWLMKLSGNDKSYNDNNHSDDGKISILNLMKEYQRDFTYAEKKYNGRTLTLIGGRVLKVQSSNEGNIVTLSSAEVYDKKSGIGVKYQVDCYFSSERVKALKPGQNFTATGIWKRNKLINCVWITERPAAERNVTYTPENRPQRKRTRKMRLKDKILAVWLILGLAAFIYVLLFGNK